MGGERTTTDRQQRILDVIREFTREHGYPPSVREIGERVGLSSSSTVQSHLRSLERHGLIRRDPTKPRALVTQLPVRTRPEPALDAEIDDQHGGAGAERRRAPEVAVLPVVGKVAAGVPITASENIDGEFVLPVDFVHGKSDAFVLRVSGDSMVDAAILDGDMIVVQPQPRAENGEIVVAMIDGEATVKRFYREAHRVRLQPENRTMAPIYADDVTILGRVEAVIRRL